MTPPERLSVPDTELSRPALVLAQRFVQRWDLHAHQLDNGRYVCVHEPLNVGHLLDHLRGEITLAGYLLGQESRARFVILDADDAQALYPKQDQPSDGPRFLFRMVFGVHRLTGRGYVLAVQSRQEASAPRASDTKE